MVEVYVLLWPVIVFLIVLKLFQWIYQWRNPKCNGKLPPGSMGFPIIGETFEFMKPHEAIQFSSFAKKRFLRHGPVFRTSLFEAKVILSTDIELNMEIAKSSRTPDIKKTLAVLLGENNLFGKSKESHKHARHLTFKLFGSQALKSKIIQDIDLLARRHIEVGAMNKSLDVKETASKILIECLAKKVMGDMEPKTTEELIQCWRYFPSGWFRFSFNFPGTGIYRLLKERKRMMMLIKDMVLKKRSSREELGDFLKIIFKENEEGGEKMGLDSAIEYIYILFFVANETTPSILAATIKLISENPKVMLELQREHKGIVRNRIDKEAGLTWEEYKSMTFTQMVINESLRITSTVPTILRIVENDIKFGDYTIPAGWTFMGYANVHFNPQKYDDPLTFNPWRWKDKDLGVIVSKSYLPFGAGSRLCVGAEFAKLQMSIFIHHLSTYRWSMKANTTVIRRHILMFPHGCDVQISED